MLSLGACKDDYTYPNVLTELTEVQTNAQGRIKQLTTDRGETFIVSEQSAANKFTADSLYRMLTVFEPIEGEVDQIRVYSARPVFSKIPQPEFFFKEGIKTDPVDIQSIWRSGNYLNMILCVQTKDHPHKFHFVNHGIKTYGNSRTSGQNVLELTFYHDRGKDYEAFTTKYIFSIPLKGYESKMKKGDKIRFSLNTYKEGLVTREFDF